MFSIRRHPVFFVVLFAPALLLVGGLMLFPIVNGIRLSFTNASPLRAETRFVGVENFIYLFEDPRFWEVLGNTVYICGLSTIFCTILGLVVALLLDSGIRFVGFFRAAVFQVWVVPWIVIAILWGWLFNDEWGIVNQFLRSTGIIEGQMAWMFEPKLAPWVVIFAYSWRAVPFVMVIALAALQGIPKEVNEAAEIDGAGYLNRLRHITLPLLQNILLVAALLEAVRFLQEVTIPLVLTQGGPIGATNVLSLFTYKAAFTEWDFGLASAAGTVWLLFVIVFAGVYNRFLLRKSA
ncbi:sugar ABC transporter permease [Cognatishimia sp. SS12]|uniref:carbohydrate ABC transporter permease n=1 Tax=Cognatishimia sp. SS12 TaxID=2979465 RepID=UPI00232C5FFA|nr:sugar ABC transporter permease [Cognatishimia sp. SS12]MDC0738304.1 sugar ABC transporter permease [Cognatishimia sp. SS12]